MFSISGIQTLLNANGIKNVFAEPGVEYLPKAEEYLKQAQKTAQEYKPLAKVEELKDENHS